MKKPAAALTSFMADQDDAAPAKFSETAKTVEPEGGNVRALPPRKPKELVERNDAQIVLKVPEAFERQFKSYAAAHGKKLNKFFMELFREHLEREKPKA